jgi:uncharacterized membrane protein YphA (DoxX/SURF4 family)
MGVALIFLGISDLLKALGEPITVARDSIAAVGGVFLLAGLWTPVTGAFIAIDELWMALSLYSSPQNGPWIHILLAVLTAALGMLGPGAWSIDSHLFGRKRFDIRDQSRRKKPFH